PDEGVAIPTHGSSPVDLTTHALMPRALPTVVRSAEELSPGGRRKRGSVRPRPGYRQLHRAYARMRAQRVEKLGVHAHRLGSVQVEHARDGALALAHQQVQAQGRAAGAMAGQQRVDAV